MIIELDEESNKVRELCQDYVLAEELKLLKLEIGHSLQITYCKYDKLIDYFNMKQILIELIKDQCTTPQSNGQIFLKT